MWRRKPKRKSCRPLDQISVNERFGLPNDAVARFIDGDRKNVAIDNLELVPKKQWR
jgi:hypothetical protein